MPSPKSGTPGSIVPPAAPDDAVDADESAAGSVDDVTANPQTKQAGSQDTTQVKPFKPPQTKEEKAKKLSWIEIAMVDEDKKPVPGVRYQITVPDGSVAEGTLDDQGLARVDGIEPGTCQITFPDLDKDAWEPA